ncbi:MAG: tRNA-guanine transglycosylase, partial [Chloroflexota bacterium]
TRVARNGALFTAQGRRNITNSGYQCQAGPVDPGCGCYTCRTFSAAYLHHLFSRHELLAYRLATIHNLHFISRLVGQVREAIGNGSFSSFRDGFRASYQPTDEAVRLEQKGRWLASRRPGGL